MTVGSTWRVSVDRLAQRSPAAVALFRLAAFLGADEIPLARLTPPPLIPAELAEALGGPFQRNKATAALGEYSLAETADGLLSVHRMVQAVTRNLARTLQALGQLDQARTMEEQVLEARGRVLGQDHSATIEAMTSLVQTLQAQGHNKEAGSLLAEALAISLRHSGRSTLSPPTSPGGWHRASSRAGGEPLSC